MWQTQKQKKLANDGKESKVDVATDVLLRPTQE
jgi:hypothetical protein